MEPGLHGLAVPDASRVVDGASGQAVLVNDRAGLDWSGLLGISIHELAHTLVEAPWTMSVPPETVKAHVAGCAARWDPVAAGASPWLGHGPEFQRAAAHLHHRAARAGHELEPSAVVNNDWYGLSPFSEYIEALGLETRCWAGTPIRTILKTKPAQGFADLFSADTERHNQEQVA